MPLKTKMHQVDELLAIRVISSDLPINFDKTINEINEMLKEKNVRVVLSDTARIWLRERGYVPTMGARPLQRVVNDNIKKPLSKEILFGRLTDGGTATVDINGKDEIEFVYT